MSDLHRSTLGRFWHGGAPGLEVGDHVLPPAATGLNKTRADQSAEAGLDQISQRRDRIYVTTDPELAKVYARSWFDGIRARTHGWLYVVEVEGEHLEGDDDLLSLPGVSYQAPMGIVVAVYDRGVNENANASRRALERVLGAHAQARSSP